MNKKWLWAALAAIFVLAAFLRIDFITSVQHTIPHDTFYYDKLVRQWIETGIYAYKDTKPNAVVTPGFPLIMRAVYQLVDYRLHDPYPYLRFLNVLMSLVNLLLLFVIARRWAGNAVALLTALLAAIYPSFVWTDGAVLTEVPATLLLTSYLYVQLIAFESRKLWHALVAGALLGLTALIRPEFMPLCVPLYLCYWFQTRDRRFWKPLLVTLVGIALVMSPWWIRNVVTLDRLILTGTQTNPFTAGTYPYKNWDDGLVDRNGKTQEQIGMERLKVGFTQHTGLFLKWFTIGKLDYTYWQIFMGAGHQPYYSVIPQPNRFHQGIILSGFLGMLLSLRRWRQPLALLFVVIAVMSGIRLLFIPEYRYNFTVMPLIILFSAFAIVTVVKSVAALLWRSASKKEAFS
ncbi:MAG: hypothetical protein JWR03_451 [Cohnella sp.]|nr:hypothetical protein [Cohnella sp.]